MNHISQFTETPNQALSNRLPEKANLKDLDQFLAIQNQQHPSLVSFAVPSAETGAENCQGGMTVTPMMDDQAEGINQHTPEVLMSSEQTKNALVGNLMTCEEEFATQQLTTNSKLKDSCSSCYVSSTPNSKLCLTDFTNSKKAIGLLPNFYPVQEFASLEQLVNLQFDEHQLKRDRRICQKLSPHATRGKFGAHGIAESEPRRPYYVDEESGENQGLQFNETQVNQRDTCFSQFHSRGTHQKQSKTVNIEKPYSQVTMSSHAARKAKQCITDKHVNKSKEHLTSLIQKSNSQNRADKISISNKIKSRAVSKKMRCSSLLSQSGNITATARPSIRENAQHRKTLSTTTTRQPPASKHDCISQINRSTRNKSHLNLTVRSGGTSHTRYYERGERGPKNQRNNAKVLTKSQSLISNSGQSTRTNQQQQLQQKQLFQVGGSGSIMLTPRKPTNKGQQTLTHGSSVAKHLYKQKSSDHYSNCDNMSQTRNQKSPGARSGLSGGSLSVHAPNMFVLKSTKKLTMFKEFAITNTQKDGSLSTTSAFISPFKLKRLGKRHGVQLIDYEDDIADKLDNLDCQDNSINDVIAEKTCCIQPPENQQEVHNKTKALLKDNAAMDAYMRDLCNKYF